MHAFPNLFILTCPFCVSIQTTVERYGMLLVMLNCMSCCLAFILFCSAYLTSCSCVNTAWFWGNQICYAVCYISFTLTVSCQGLLCDSYLVPFVSNHFRYMSHCLGKRENKVVPVHICHIKRMYGGMEVWLNTFLILALDGGECWFSCLSLRKDFLILIR